MVSELTQAVDEKRHALRGMNAAISTTGDNAGITTDQAMFDSCHQWYKDAKVIAARIARKVENGA